SIFFMGRPLVRFRARKSPHEGMTRSVRQNAGGLGYIFAETANGAFKRGVKGWVMAGFCLEGVGAFGGYGGCEAALKPMHTVIPDVPYVSRSHSAW
ncbi:Uncharacterized protein ALO94_00328, partial [Pseudomonas syringae pv. spinaceae]